MLLLRLWVPRYPDTPIIPPRRGGGGRPPPSVQVAFQRTFKAEQKKKRVLEKPGVEISRPLSPLIVKAPPPREDLSPILLKLEAKLFDLTLLAGLEDQAARQEAALMLALRNREEEDLLLMLLLES